MPTSPGVPAEARAPKTRRLWFTKGCPTALLRRDGTAYGFRRSPERRKNQRFSGGTSRSLAERAATSSRLYLRCTRLSDGGCFSTDTPSLRSVAGRIGRGTNPPPQLGQTLPSLVSTQSAQNVHS